MNRMRFLGSLPLICTLSPPTTLPVAELSPTARLDKVLADDSPFHICSCQQGQPDQIRDAGRRDKFFGLHTRSWSTINGICTMNLLRQSYTL
ncbi:hypothetical protein LguiB_017932 [Lonicera macranthoides]